MARRDIRRHRWRSALIAAMIGLPVVLMVGGLTTYDTQHISAAEDVPARFGSAQGVVSARLSRVPVTGLEPDSLTCANGDRVDGVQGLWEFAPGAEATPLVCDGAAAARAVPGISTAEPSVASVSAALAALTGSRVVPVGREDVDVRVGDGSSAVGALAVDGDDPAVRGMVDLTSGRWPRAPNEVVLTDYGRRAGLGDRPVLRRPGSTSWTTAVVVGTAQAATSANSVPVALVTGPPTTLGSTRFLLDRAAPLTWQDVQNLAPYGLMAASRAVTLDPPEAALAANSDAVQLNSGVSSAAVTALLCLGLLVESCLLAGPAFAVSAQRQRRALALAAANGADRAQLRRTMLAEALVLGVATALAGALIGVMIAWAGVAALQRLPVSLSSSAEPSWWSAIGGERTFGPLSVPWTEVGIVIAFAVVAAVVSALIPARGLGRIDVVSALRDEVVSGRPHRGWPLVGAALAVAGSGVIFAALILTSRGLITDTLSAWAVIGGGVLLVVGALMLVPILLVAVGQLTAKGGVSVRMAARDAARQRGRAVPTVAAVMAGAILLSSLSLMLATYERRSQQTYAPIAPVGQAVVDLGEPADLAALRRAVSAVAPSARVSTIERGSIGADSTDSATSPGSSAPAVVFVPPGCSASEVIAQTQPASTADLGSCQAPIVSGRTGFSALAVASATDAAVLFDLDERSQQVLRQGGAALTVTGAGAAMPVVTGVVKGGTSETVDLEQDAWARETGRRVIATAPMPTPRYSFNGPKPVGVVTPQTATSLGLRAEPAVAMVASAGGLTREQVARINAETGPGLRLTLEEGYRSSSLGLTTLMFVTVALLILVATVTATLLSMGEQRRDLATLAAVGARDGIRRRIAAVQAGGLAFVGTLLGLFVGAVPGAAFSLAITDAWSVNGGIDGAFVEIPWVPLTAALVLIPLMSAGFAVLFLPRRPDLTRRTN